MRVRVHIDNNTLRHVILVGMREDNMLYLNRFKLTAQNIALVTCTLLERLEKVSTLEISECNFLNQNATEALCNLLTNPNTGITNVSIKECNFYLGRIIFDRCTSGLKVIFKALAKKPNSIIRFETDELLGSSSNTKISNTLIALINFINSKNCKLQKLLIKNHNLSNYQELDMLKFALSKNSSIKKIDLGKEHHDISPYLLKFKSHPGGMRAGLEHFHAIDDIEKLINCRQTELKHSSEKRKNQEENLSVDIKEKSEIANSNKLKQNNPVVYTYSQELKVSNEKIKVYQYNTLSNVQDNPPPYQEEEPSPPSYNNDDFDAYVNTQKEILNSFQHTLNNENIDQNRPKKRSLPPQYKK